MLAFSCDRNVTDGFLFLQELSLPVTGEATENLFSAESEGFTKSWFYLVIMIGSLTVLGTVFEMIKCYRRRKKVHPGNIFNALPSGQFMVNRRLNNVISTYITFIQRCFNVV